MVSLVPFFLYFLFLFIAVKGTVFLSYLHWIRRLRGLVHPCKENAIPETGDWRQVRTPSSTKRLGAEHG